MTGYILRRYGFIGLIVVAMLGGVVLLARNASMPAPPRDVRLVVRDMTYFVEGDDTPNPTLRFRAGERVRLILRNDDAGMKHDFVVKNWNVASVLLDGEGQTAVEFRVPEDRGTETYSCTPHAVMMRGTIAVE